MAVNCLYVAAASTAASAAALQWWAASLLDGDADADGDWLNTLLRSHVTVALLANLAAHLVLLIVIALKVIAPNRLSTYACFSFWLLGVVLRCATHASLASNPMCGYYRRGWCSRLIKLLEVACLRALC
jgi:hypothetical protein